MSQLDARPLAGEAYRLGEGVLWDPRDGALTWVDLLAGRVLAGRPDGERLRIECEVRFDVPVGALAARAGDGWVAACGDGVALLDPDGGLRWLARPEADRDGATRMNDAACDARGRLWAGSMAYAATPGAGRLYRVEPDGACAVALAGLTISNGIGWSPDGETMYLADTGRRVVDAFDFDVEHGSLAGRRALLRFPPDLDGAPDGLTVDAEGVIWVALWGGGAVHGYASDGRLQTVVRVAARQPTSCALEPGRGRLAITSATHGLDAAARDGLVFLCDVPGTGRPEPVFGG